MSLAALESRSWLVLENDDGLCSTTKGVKNGLRHRHITGTLPHHLDAVSHKEAAQMDNCRCGISDQSGSLASAWSRSCNAVEVEV